MAIKEFEFGPQQYFEADYTSGDYTAPGIVRSLLQCDVDSIYGGIVLTGEYYEGEYIDGTYFHDNSIKSSFSCDSTKVITAEVELQDYFEEGYFEEEYTTNKGARFAVALNAEVGALKEAEADFGALFTPTMSVSVIKNSFSIMDAVFTPTVDANATFVANQITLDSIINQSLMDDDIRVRTFTFSTNTSDPLNPTYSTFTSTVFIDVPQTTLFKGYEANFTENFLTTSNVVITTDTDATLNSNVTMACDALLVKIADADITSSSSVYAQPISYEVRTFTNRPYTPFQDGYVKQTVSNGQFVYPLTFDTSLNGGLEKYTQDSSESSISNITPNSFLMDGEYYNGAGTHAFSYTFLESRQSTYHQFYESDFAVSFYYNYFDTDINRNNLATIFRMGYANTEWSAQYINETTSNILCASGASNQFGGYDAIEVIADRTGDGSPYDLLVNVNIGSTTHKFTSSSSPQGWIRIIRSGDDLTVYRNNTSLGTQTVSGNFGTWRYIGFYPHEQPGTQVNTWVNNLIIQKGTDEIKTSNGSYNGTPLNDEYTFARYTFDGTMEDVTENWLVDTGAQTDNVVATMTTVPNAVKDGVTIHLGTASLSISTEVLKPANVSILSDFNLQANVESVVTLVPASLDSEFSVISDNQIARTFTASINSITNTTVTATRIKPLDAEFDSIATTINVINKIGSTLVEFTPGVFSTTVSADRLRGIDGIEPSVFDVSATATHIKNFEIDNATLLAFVTADVNYRPDVFMDNGGLGTLQADISVTREFDAQIASEFTTIPTTRGISGFTVVLDSEFVSTVDVGKIVNVDAELTTSSSVNSTVNTTASGEATLQAQTIQTTTQDRIRDVETVFDSIATSASAVAKIGDFLITLESAFTTETEITRTSGVGSIIDATTTINSTPYRLRDIDVGEETATFTQVAYGTKGTDTIVSANSTTTVEADINVVIRGEATFGSALSFSVSIKATRNNEVDLGSNFGWNAISDRIRNTQSTVETVATTQTNAGKIVEVDSDITVETSMTAQGKIVTFAIVYTIPKEDRTFSINNESREYQVQFETREYTLEGA